MTQVAQDKAGRRELAEGVLEQVTDGLADIVGDRLRSVQGERRPSVYDHGLVVRPHDLLERCPSRSAQPSTGDFAWSTRAAQRQIGLGALRLLEDDSSEVDDLGRAVAEVVANRSALGQSLAAWVDDLGRGGVAALTAAAVTWAAGLRRVVPPDPRVRWADPSSKTNWDHPDRLVRVVASHDASLGGVASGEVLLLVADSDSGSTDRLRAAHLALVRSMLSRHSPVRVTVASPSRGEKVHFQVDRALLDLAVDRLVEHVALRLDPPTAPVRPGRWCSHCHLVEVCEAHT